MKKTALYSLVFGGVSLIAATGLVFAASAAGPGFSGSDFSYGMMQKRGFNRQPAFQFKADALGLTVEQLKQELDSGKNFLDIAKEKGITPEQFHEKMEAQMKIRFDEMVKAGTITQAEADQRIKFMEERQQNCPMFNSDASSTPGFGYGFGQRKMGFNR